VHAATPGDIKRHGAGLTIRHGTHPSPFGDCLIGVTPLGVCWLSFPKSEQDDDTFQKLWPRAQFRHDPEATGRIVKRIFTGGEVDLHLIGTNLQIKVWEALMRIPAGAVTTYEAIATQVHTPAATRAVANAVANNRISYLIPCHRVIRKTGGFGGYRWGLPRKRAMLAWEAARRSSSGFGGEAAELQSN
jgi:AraC family transcriptional regulator of adaptative response/methylated-DNA-[protein]-cysteine methyltransferase